MKYLHSIKLTVFSYENENEKKILGAFLKFFPFSLEENKIALVKKSASGFKESSIGIFEVILAKASIIRQFLEALLSQLTKEQKNTIIRQSESRLDKNFDFFIRFDKEEWIRRSKLELTDSGKCFHLKMSIATFPKKREVGLKIVNELFSK